MYCGYCGNRIRDDAMFCSFCGKPVKKAVEAEVPIEPTIPDSADKRDASDAKPEFVKKMAGKSDVQSTVSTIGTTRLEVKKPTTPIQSTERSALERTNAIYDFVFVPPEWTYTVNTSQPAPSTPPSKNPEQTIRDSVKEKTEQYGKVIQKKTVQYSTAAKEKAAAVGTAAKEKAIQYGDLAKQKAEKLGSAAKEKAAEGMGRLQTAPIKRIEKHASVIIGIASKISLLLILLAAFVPYCRIAYSSERTADMPLWKLIFGGTYTMGNSNPLQFTLYAHPELVMLLLLPLLILIPKFFRKSKRRLAASSGILTADGLLVLIWNGSVLKTMQYTVSGMTLETFEKHVASMNSVVIKWVQQVIADSLSFANTFYVIGRFGFALFVIFGWLMLLMGTAGFIVILLRTLKKKRPIVKRTEPASYNEDDVPELPEDML